MKRIYLLLAVMVGLLMVPNMVEAEVKKVGDIVYTMETNSIYDYLCDDLVGHEVSVGTYENDKLLVYDHTDSGKQYLVDLEKEASCTEINPSYTDEEFYIDYVWEKIIVFTWNLLIVIMKLILLKQVILKLMIRKIIM